MSANVDTEEQLGLAWIDIYIKLEKHSYHTRYIMPGGYDSSKTVFGQAIGTGWLTAILQHAPVLDAIYDEGWRWNTRIGHQHLRVLLTCNTNIVSQYHPATRFVEAKLDMDKREIRPVYPGVM